MRVALVAIAVAACGGAAVAPPAGSTPDPLVGLWGADLDFDVGPSGTLHVVPVGDGWRARLGTTEAPLTVDGDELTGDVGGGRVRLRRAGDALGGFWIQPPTVADPGYASPLALVRDPDGAYHATVAPLRPNVHVYLSIARDGGALRAFVREPGHNLGRQLGVMSVVRHGDAVELRTADGTVALHGRLAGEHLELTVDRIGLALELTRRGRDGAPGFYPRPAGATTDLVTPADLGDGWPVGSPAAVGLDEAPLRALVQAVAEAVPTSPRSPAIHAIVVARHGVLVVDEYFAGHRADGVHDTRSAGKSFTTTLAGIAIDRGELALMAPVYAAIGAAPDDPRKQDIQLRHALSMSTGLACDDHDADSAGNEDRMQAEADWVRYTLGLPVAHPPGEHAAYCSGTLNLVGAAIAGPKRAWLPERLHADLMAPLDIAHYYMNLQPDGQGYMGGGLQLRTRDLAKLAQVFLDRGTWRGKRIVSAAWVDAATSAHASLNRPDDYGYGWWRIRYHVGDATYDAFYASGNGGQLAIAIPALDLVVAIQAGNFNDYPTWRTFLEDAVPRHVLAAVEREAP